MAFGPPPPASVERIVDPGNPAIVPNAPPAYIAPGFDNGTNYQGELADNTNVNKSSPVQTIINGTWIKVNSNHSTGAGALKEFKFFLVKLCLPL